MADTREFQLPGGMYLNQEANDTEWQTPGGLYLNEEATAAVGARRARIIFLTGEM